MGDTLREKVTFENQRGDQLAAALDYPSQGTRAYALFAHCFTCSKDSIAAYRISQALCGQGIGVLRFDFTGLGGSEGDFANTNFSSNVQDLLAAADHMRKEFQAPQILIGHSLGGTAVVAAAQYIPESEAVATIGAPSEVDYIRHLLEEQSSQVEASGTIEVVLGENRVPMQEQFLEDISRHRMEACLVNLERALLVFHSPADEIVGIDQGQRIFELARHPKNFIALDQADHLLRDQRDSEYVAQVLAAWVSRFLDTTGTEKLVDSSG
jgi:putative redox protein